MTLFVVVIDDANELEAQIPAVFAQPHHAEQYVRKVIGTSARRDVIAVDHVQYANADGDLFIKIYEVTVRAAD